MAPINAPWLQNDSRRPSGPDLFPERTVLVHDYLNQHGGAERVLEAMADLAPHASVYTSIFNPNTMPAEYQRWALRTSWINAIPGSSAHHQWMLPAYPVAFERMSLPPCDLVLSSSSAFAKMARPPDGAVHISYIHSPMRFAWDFPQYGERERLPRLARKALPPFMSLLRWRDQATTSRVDRFIANSTAVRDRIRAFWRRDATVIFPPVNVDRFTPVPADQVEDYFLIISRLVPYKRIDIAVDAFNHLGLPLRIIGDGRDRAALEKQAGPNIQFLGRVTDEDLRHAYAHCRAAVFISEDDFGIAQVEAQAAGRPVVALAAGGVLDTVIPGETGVWVKERSVEALIDAIRRFQCLGFNPERLVNHAERFSTARFKHDLTTFVADTLDEIADRRTDWS